MANSLKKVQLPDTVGGFTLPTEVGQEEKVKELYVRWKADAIRDCDGTELSPELLGMAQDVYSTICLVRCDQKLPHEHPEFLPRKFLKSHSVPAFSSTLAIELLEGLHPEKYQVDTSLAGEIQVFDETAKKVLPASDWSLAGSTVKVGNTVCGHLYSAAFPVTVIWDTTSMYNHITNNWNRPHVVSTDPYCPEARKELYRIFDRWLAEHPSTSVVRLTSLAYHFNVDCGPKGEDVFRDWTGIQESVSAAAMDDFEKEYGYRLTAADFVDGGLNNAVAHEPSPKWLDYMDFMHRFVVKYCADLCEKSHAAGKKTAMFHGDHWAGSDPFEDDFEKAGVDIHIGAAEDGVALRRVSDLPGKQVKELRLYPYFFPDVFREGNDPIEESRADWLKIRRALLRKPVDRIGYGGYLSLALKFPKFIAHIDGLIREFREIRTLHEAGAPCRTSVKVGVLNAWGRRRAWINSFGREQKFLKKRTDVVVVAGTNLLECLAGLPVEVEFLSFRDLKKQGCVPSGIDVLINDGDAGTAWSGGSVWEDPEIQTMIRNFVSAGGGLIGCRGASACVDGKLRLADVFGIDYENGISVQNCAPAFEVEKDHFITSDNPGVDFGKQESFLYRAGDPSVLAAYEGHILLAAQDYGKGRSVFFAGLPESAANARMLLKAILWSARKESELQRNYSSSPETDCAFFPESQTYCVLNRSSESLTTTLYDNEGTPHELQLPPCGAVYLQPEKN